MKLILSLIFVIVSLINSSHCFNESKCFSLGHPCVQSYGIDISCGYGLACLPIDDNDEQSEYVCKPKLKLGEKCKEKYLGPCEIGLECLPLDFEEDSQYTCKAANYAGLGEDCDSDFDCFGVGQFNLKCTNSKCTFWFNKTLQNDKINCLGYFTCPGTQACNLNNCEDDITNCSSSCTPLSSLGGNCSYDSDCFIGGVCSKDGICLSRYSKKLNDSCSTNNECDLGLGCQRFNEFFNEDESYQEFKKCIEIEIPNTTNCTEDGCGDYGICNGVTNTCHPKKKNTNECKYAERVRDICIISNKCSFSNEFYDYPYFNENSCTMKKCRKETINVLKQCQTIYTACD
ncbi:hypothetical protein ACTFIR_008290 [Dictyostelium discoideum]